MIDIDALIAEQMEASWTEVIFRGREWKFATLADVPPSLYEEKPADSLSEVTLLARILSMAICEEQRADFAELTITSREAWALYAAIIETQQGLTPGESEASSPSYDKKATARRSKRTSKRSTASPSPQGTSTPGDGSALLSEV